MNSQDIKNYERELRKRNIRNAIIVGGLGLATIYGTFNYLNKSDEVQEVSVPMTIETKSMDMYAPNDLFANVAVAINDALRKTLPANTCTETQAWLYDNPRFTAALDDTCTGILILKNAETHNKFYVDNDRIVDAYQP